MEVKELYNRLDKFTEIYKDGKEINPLPKNKKLTVFCSGDEDEGFIENVTTSEMGLEIFMAKKWILQEGL